MKVAIQGVKGCFHEIAAYKYFGEREVIETVECSSFPQLFNAIDQNKEVYGVMAIENTVAGTILPNYALLRDAPMQVIGEVYLRIKQNLLVCNGTNLSKLQEVRSHPMAIKQCLSFFKPYPHIKLTETEDTALSAREISENKSKHIGAIASSLAADHYDLNILAESIETNKRNFTRFLIIRHNDQITNKTQQANKASICFHLSHDVGALAKVLTIFAEHNVNLSKIQSLPVIGKEWEYFFHVGFEFDDYDVYRHSLEDIQPYVQELQILGEYRKGIKHRTI